MVTPGSERANPVATRPQAQAHVTELDGVRGLAILTVMALHFFASQIIEPQNAFERLARDISGYGMWGVDLFFVLSGYLITGLLAESRESTRYFSSFYMRRTLRIFPLYYGVILLLVVLIPRAVLQAHAPEALQIRDVQAWLWTYLVNIYVALQGDYTIPYVSHFWTLAIEEHFYLFWPLVIRLASRRAAMGIAVALALAALLSRLVLAFTMTDGLWAHVFTFCRLDSLCIGAFVALWARGAEGWAVMASVRRLLPWAAGAMLLLVLVPGKDAWHEANLATKQFVLAVLCAFLIGLAAWPAGWAPMKVMLRQPPLVALGRYSYGLYVYHGIIAYYFVAHGTLAYFAAAGGSHTAGLLLQALAGFALSLVVAMASFHFYESPFLKLKRLFRA